MIRAVMTRVVWCLTYAAVWTLILVQCLALVVVLLCAATVLLPLFLLSIVGRTIDHITSTMSLDVLDWTRAALHILRPRCICGQHTDEEEEGSD